MAEGSALSMRLGAEIFRFRSAGLASLEGRGGSTTVEDSASAGEMGSVLALGRVGES